MADVSLFPVNLELSVWDPQDLYFSFCGYHFGCLTVDMYVWLSVLKVISATFTGERKQAVVFLSASDLWLSHCEWLLSLQLSLYFLVFIGLYSRTYILFILQVKLGGTSRPPSLTQDPVILPWMTKHLFISPQGRVYTTQLMQLMSGQAQIEPKVSWGGTTEYPFNGC